VFCVFIVVLMAKVLCVIKIKVTQAKHFDTIYNIICLKPTKTTPGGKGNNVPPQKKSWTKVNNLLSGLLPEVCRGQAV